jgi:predicted ATPase
MRKKPIRTLTIKGFKSIRELKEFKLQSLNVLIGANGAGKSNFVSFFKMLGELVEGRLQAWTLKQGGADRLLSFGIKETNAIEISIRFGYNGYDVILEPATDGSFVISNEQIYFYGPYFGETKPRLGSGHSESRLKQEIEDGASMNIASYCYDAISSWKVFHFHDTSDTAGVKRLGALHDCSYLRSDASNLAAYLFHLKQNHPETYSQIRKNVALAIPFFDDFVLKPSSLPSGEQQIRLLWKQKDSDYALWPSQLSDGSLRFICLVTALMQPNPLSTIIIDEPELGLHPYALVLLGALIRAAAKRMQVIVSTQSVPLLNEFSISDLIIVEREKGVSTFKRLNQKDFKNWLEDYSVGELWEKNVLGGRPN